MRYPNTDQLRSWLTQYPVLAQMDEFELDEAQFQKHLIEVKGRPESERRDAAAFRCMPWNSWKSVKVKEKTETGSGSSAEQILVQQDQIVRNHSAQLSQQRELAESITSALGTLGASQTSAAEALKESVLETRSRIAEIVEDFAAGSLSSQKTAIAGFSEISGTLAGMSRRIDGARSQLNDVSTHITELIANEHAVEHAQTSHTNEYLDGITKELESIGRQCQSIAGGIALILEQQRELAVPMFSKNAIRWAVIGLAALIFIFGTANLAHGQNVNPDIAVTTCGTPPTPYPAAGARAPGTVNTNGQECISGTFTGTVTGTVTANQGTAGTGPWPMTLNSSSVQTCPTTAIGTTCAVGLTVQGSATGVPIPMTNPLTTAFPSMATDGTALAIYAGTLSTLGTLTTTAGGGANITTNTITINSLHCFNITATAATVTRADSSGLTLQTSFSIPGNSDVYLVSTQAMEKQTGLALWSGSNNAIRCIMSARQ